MKGAGEGKSVLCDKLLGTPPNFLSIASETAETHPNFLGRADEGSETVPEFLGCLPEGARGSGGFGGREGRLGRLGVSLAFQKAAEGCRSPKPKGSTGALVTAPASWRAAVLCCFALAVGRRDGSGGDGLARCLGGHEDAVEAAGEVGGGGVGPEDRGGEGVGGEEIGPGLEVGGGLDGVG